MYTNSLLKLAQNLSELNHFSQARSIVKLAVWSGSSSENIIKDHTRRVQKLKDRGIESNLTEDQIKVILSIIDNQIKAFNKAGPIDELSRCSYCNKPILVRNTISVDRIDNDKGYALGNIVLCCRECNIMKGDYSISDFLTYTFNISKNLKDIGGGKQKVLNDASRLQNLIQDYLSNKTFQPRPENIPSKPSSENYNQYNNEIVNALAHILNISGEHSLNAKDYIKIAGNLLNEKFPDSKLTWEPKSLKDYITKNWDTLHDIAQNISDNTAQESAILVLNEIKDYFHI